MLMASEDIVPAEEVDVEEDEVAIERQPECKLSYARPANYYMWALEFRQDRV